MPLSFSSILGKRAAALFFAIIFCAIFYAQKCKKRFFEVFCDFEKPIFVCRFTNLQ